jgi:hypothetical protein
LSEGEYQLAVLYHDQTVTVIPIRLDDSDIEVPPIEVPATGSIRGVMKHWIHSETDSTPSVDPPFSNGTISPFRAFALTRGRLPTCKFFRVDHLGRFELEDVLVG